MDHFLRRRRNERDNIFETEQLENGWRVTCRIMNGQQELMSVCLYVPDAKYVEIVRNRFFDDPEYIYRINMSYLTNSKSIAPGGKQQ
ncbi:MAG: DUF4364 family protein, partial [Clostridia bacterium]|nr:DUF4364 family protein [Clostridia bacterium]